MSSEAAIKREIFLSVLRNYYFSKPEVQQHFWAYEEEEYNKLKDMGEDVPDKELNSRNLKAREASFQQFLDRLTHGGPDSATCGQIYNGDGKPYGEAKSLNNGTYTVIDLDKIGEDFYEGKPVVFMGTGQDGMIRLQANKDLLNRVYVDVNMEHHGDAAEVPKVYDYTKYLREDDEDFKDPVSIRQWEASDIRGYVKDVAYSPERPGNGSWFDGSWWNAIHKFLFGTPSAAWAAYENALKVQKVAGLRAMAEVDKTGQLAERYELSEANLRAADRAGNVSKKDREAVEEHTVNEAKKLAEKQKNAQEEAKEIKETEEIEANGKTEEIEEEIIKNSGVGREEETEEKVEEKAVPAEAKNDGKKPETGANQPEAPGRKELRQQICEQYRKDMEGTQKSSGAFMSGVNMSMARDDQFRKLEGGFAAARLPAAVSMLAVYADAVHTLKTSDDSEKKEEARKIVGDMENNQAARLAKHLAQTYLLGKLQNEFAERGGYHAEEDFDFLSEFYQITSRYGDILKKTTELFQKGKFIERVKGDPEGTLDTFVFNPDKKFCDWIDASLKAGGYDEIYSDYVKGVGEIKDLKALREKEKEITAGKNAAKAQPGTDLNLSGGQTMQMNHNP